MKNTKELMETMSDKLSDPTKYCENCKWALKPKFIDWLIMGKKHNTRFMKCGNPKLARAKSSDAISPYLKKIPDITFCGINREFDHLCGQNGQHFEPKEKNK